MAVKQNGIVVKQQATAANAPQDLNALVRRMAPAFKRALPSVMTAERFTRIALTALNSNPALAKCSQKSFLGSLMNAAQLGLEPNTPLGHAYLIPYKGECTFQIGYKGLIDLARRSDDISVVSAKIVYKNDDFTCEFGLNPILRHKPFLNGDRGEVVTYYAYYKTKDGGFDAEVMSRSDAENHGIKYSKAYNNGPWSTAFDEMAKKTVLKKVLKYAPLKSEFFSALSTDGATIYANETAPDDLNIVYTSEPDEVNGEKPQETPVPSASDEPVDEADIPDFLK